MARWFRIWEKKRGPRSTGSQIVGNLGEATFFGALFFLGTTSFATLWIGHFLNRLPVGLGPYHVSFWLMVLVLLSFILIGGGGLFYTLFRVGTSAERRSSLAKRAAAIELISDKRSEEKQYPHVPRLENFTNSPGVKLAFRLPITHSPGWRVAAAAAFCFVWNGIAIMLLIIAAKSHFAAKQDAGREPEWFLTIFSIPFLAIGLWAIYYFLGQIWMNTSIGPTTIEIGSHPLLPGQENELHLSQAGHVNLKRLDLKLICAEEATFSQGTDIRTERRVVFERSLASEEDISIDPANPFELACTMEIPPNAMHSFQANHNAVQWQLLVSGSPDGWPNYERSFPILVYPANPGA